GSVSLRVVFFFQAEDGIRDWSVTGVQTCALPIFLAGWPASGRPVRGLYLARAHRAATRPRGPLAVRRGAGRPARRRPAGRRGNRSEERRVGKEGRCRGALYD